MSLLNLTAASLFTFVVLDYCAVHVVSNGQACIQRLGSCERSMYEILRSLKVFLYETRGLGLMLCDLEAIPAWHVWVRIIFLLRVTHGTSIRVAST